MAEKTLFINGKEVAFDNEKNLLEVIRKAGIDLPTLCYHPMLKAYGACRLCVIENSASTRFTTQFTLPTLPSWKKALNS